jgi:hypothetical protein
MSARKFQKVAKVARCCAASIHRLPPAALPTAVPTVELTGLYVAQMKIVWENAPRFVLPVVIAISLAIFLSQVLELSMAVCIPLSLFAVVQLQKNEIL